MGWSILEGLVLRQSRVPTKIRSQVIDLKGSGTGAKNYFDVNALLFCAERARASFTVHLVLGTMSPHLPGVTAKSGK